MPSSLVPEIAFHLSQYLAGTSSLEEFDRWFVSATWDVKETEDPAAYEMTSKIYLRLAEYTRGDWTEEELKSEMRQFVTFDQAAALTAKR